ncbi:MAG: hypothetical protein JKY94_17590 [Rhodobacteraceae bacterium]|nr:hypothetical protein [Paracoccaceae bacterium]
MELTGLSEDFIRLYNAVRNDIFKFCQCLNFEPTDQQVPILSAVQSLAYYGKPTHMAVKSGQGPGKTTIAAIIGLWRTFRNFGARTVVTAPTMRQCKEVWLAEARNRLLRGHTDFSKLFEVRATDIEIMGIKDWGIELASASRPENMQGWHNEHLSFIVDEASGVDREIIETIMGTLTNPDPLFLQIGNPNTRGSAFFDAFNREAHQWWTMTLNAEESPMVNQANIARLAELYGRESDVYRVRVLGEFPNQDPNTVMNSDDLTACTTVEQKFKALRATRDKQFGVDFARFGDDASVMYRRSGLAIVDQHIKYKSEPIEIVRHSFKRQERAKWHNRECQFVADAGGVGQGLMHNFIEADKRLFEFHFGGRAMDSRKYDDAATEAFFHLGHLVKQRKVYIPKDHQLISELSNRQYYFTNKNKLKVESKKEYRKRIQDGSPDRADAAIMAFYNVGGLAGQVT